MSDMPSELHQEPGAAPRREVTVEVDRRLGESLRAVAKWQGISEQDLLIEALEQHPKVSGQRSVTVQISEASAARLAAAAATIGMNEEELIAEAVDHYTPSVREARFWPALGIPGLLAALPLVLLSLSPSIGPSASAGAWTVFALAMLACAVGAIYLVTVVTYAEWTVIKYGITGLVSSAVCGAMSVLTAFAYTYWLVSNLSPGSFDARLGRIDAVYFTIGTFTATGTGRFAAASSHIELLLLAQVVLGWSFVAILLALLVPRAQAARKRLSTGRIIVRSRPVD